MGGVFVDMARLSLYRCLKFEDDLLDGKKQIQGECQGLLKWDLTWTLGPAPETATVEVDMPSLTT